MVWLEENAPREARGVFGIGETVCLFHLRDNAVEGLWTVFCESGENFAVELHALCFEQGDECAVPDAVRADGGVEPGDPQCAKIAFLVAPMVKGVQMRMVNRFDRRALFLRAGESIPLYLAENILPTFRGHYSSFYSRHTMIILVGQ